MTESKINLSSYNSGEKSQMGVIQGAVNAAFPLEALRENLLSCPFRLLEVTHILAHNLLSLRPEKSF